MPEALLAATMLALMPLAALFVLARSMWRRRCDRGR